MRQWLIILLVFLASCPVFAQRQLIKRIDKVTKSIVTVITYNDTDGIDGLGTGFFVTKEGNIQMSAHIIQGASYAVAVTSNGERFPIVYVVKWSDTLDLCEVTIFNFGKRFDYLKLDRHIASAGQKVFTVGTPGGYRNVDNAGIICKNEKLIYFHDVYITSIPVIPGMSGSPLINYNNGKVIGIIDFWRLEGDNTLNFAISTNNYLLMKPVFLKEFPKDHSALNRL